MLMRPRRSFWSPGRDLTGLQREMNRLFDARLAPRYQRAPGFPAMNVWTSEEAVVVTAELPGVSLEDMDVTVLNETLTVRGGRAPDEEVEGSRFHRRERTYGQFSRTIQLPYAVNADKVEATLKNGLLRLWLPRLEEDRPRKIAVKGS